MSLLEKVNYPSDLRALDPEDLPILAQELRDYMVMAVSQTGGHLGAGLGVVELTIALHYVFNTPDDRLVWDVGHQTYPHKILTGRKHLLNTLRQKGGLSGFTRRSESIYDPFGAAHSSTSISAALGMANARDRMGLNHHVIAVIGDGAMSAGMAFEAMNNVGKTRLIVVLNDNDMSIARPVGALSAYLSRVLSTQQFFNFRKFSYDVIHKLPNFIEEKAKLTDEFVRGMVQGSNFFEKLGFYYLGLVDGHEFDHLLPILSNIRSVDINMPILLHVKTEKGKGYAPAEQARDRYHGVNRFNIDTGLMVPAPSNRPQWTKIFGETLGGFAQNDNKIIALTAAMPSGTGLDIVQKMAPHQVIDVGIAEQHAVTFAAGLATEGFKPFVAIYSTFMQRAYDQLIHDAVLQGLPVRFCLDRAGLVGADGATHAGMYDLAYMCCLPNIVVMAPSDSNELKRMLATMVAYDKGVIAMRYPRGEANDSDEHDVSPLEIGKARILLKGTGSMIWALGAVAHRLCALAQRLPNPPTIVDARFAKPIDHELLWALIPHHEKIITVEEGSIGGFSAQVSHFLMEKQMLTQIEFYGKYIADKFIDHATQSEQNYDAGFDDDSLLSLMV